MWAETPEPEERKLLQIGPRPCKKRTEGEGGDLPLGQGRRPEQRVNGVVTVERSTSVRVSCEGEPTGRT